MTRTNEFTGDRAEDGRGCGCARDSAARSYASCRKFDWQEGRTLQNPPTKKIADVSTPAEGGPAVDSAAATDPGEEAYTEGFHQWEAGQYDQAISTLKAFTGAYPKHRRLSYANNLIGRAMLDKGDARGAASALLSNYRTNPGGERAPDSLYYLGQALMKLGQPGQACKAYSEMDAVYGAKIRPDLKKLETDGKAQAQCS